MQGNGLECFTYLIQAYPALLAHQPAYPGFISLGSQPRAEQGGGRDHDFRPRRQASGTRADIVFVKTLVDFIV